MKRFFYAPRKNFFEKFFQSVLPARFGQKSRGEFGGGFGRDISTTFWETGSPGGGGRFFFSEPGGEFGRKISTTFLEKKPLDFCRGDFLGLWVRFGFYFQLNLTGVDAANAI